MADIPRIKFSERRAAKRAASENLADAVEAERARRAEARAADQAELDDLWRRLNENDPEIVLSLLEQAFEDNEAPAAAVSCAGGRVDVLVRWPDLEEIVPERQASTTPTGNPTTKKRNKGERAEFYLWALASNALVTAKEAFAVCPAVETLGLAVVRTGPDAARGDEIVESIFLGTVSREQIADVNWATIKPIATLLELCRGRIGLKGKGTNKTLYGLSVSDEDEVAFMDSIGSGLERRPLVDGVAGIELPVGVVHS